MPGKSTTDLIAWYDRATPDERYYLKLELDKRYVTATIHVVTQEDIFGDDEVLLTFGAAGVATSSTRIKEGSTGTVQIAVGRLLPLEPSLSVSVFEYDVLDPNDLIGTITWPAPYASISTNVTGDEANYDVTLTL
jgi:hypothetical protein